MLNSVSVNVRTKVKCYWVHWQWWQGPSPPLQKRLSNNKIKEPAAALSGWLIRTLDSESWKRFKPVLSWQLFLCCVTSNKIQLASPHPRVY